MKIFRTNTNTNEVNFADLISGALDFGLNNFVVPQVKGSLYNYLLEKDKEKKIAQKNKPVIEN